MGWAIRGEWGNWWGETVPGALIGMALWLGFGVSEDLWQMLAFGAALAVAHTVGGEISYGKIVGYVKDEHDRSPAFGIFGLFLVGGMIGFFPATALGLLLTDVAYDLASLGLWAVLSTAGALLAYKLLVLGLRLRLSPPRSDYWAATLGASLASLAFFGLVSPDRVVILTESLGWCGYGMGFALGGLLHRMATRRRWRFDSWKWMEHSVGFFGTLGLVVAVLALGGDIGELGLSTEAMFLSALVVLWFVPYLVATDVFQDWTFRLWHIGTSASVNLLEPDDPGSRARPRNGEIWRTITSRELFLATQIAAACSLVLVALLLPSLALNGADGGSGKGLFCLLVTVYTLIAVAKNVPIERGRERLIVWATFAGMAGLSLLLSVPS